MCTYDLSAFSEASQVHRIKVIDQDKRFLVALDCMLVICQLSRRGNAIRAFNKIPIVGHKNITDFVYYNYRVYSVDPEVDNIAVTTLWGNPETISRVQRKSPKKKKKEKGKKDKKKKEKKGKKDK